MMFCLWAEVLLIMAQSSDKNLQAKDHDRAEYLVVNDQDFRVNVKDFQKYTFWLDSIYFLNTATGNRNEEQKTRWKTCCVC